MQGVGFRPFVYELALANHLKGWVLNGNDGVHIEINASEDIAQDFLKQLLASSPPLSKIQHYSLAKVSYQAYQGFAIVESKFLQKLRFNPKLQLCKYSLLTQNL